MGVRPAWARLRGGARLPGARLSGRRGPCAARRAPRGSHVPVRRGARAGGGPAPRRLAASMQLGSGQRLAPRPGGATVPVEPDPVRGPRQADQLITRPGPAATDARAYRTRRLGARAPGRRCGRARVASVKGTRSGRSSHVGVRAISAGGVRYRVGPRSSTAPDPRLFGAVPGGRRGSGGRPRRRGVVVRLLVVRLADLFGRLVRCLDGLLPSAESGLPYSSIRPASSASWKARCSSANWDSDLMSMRQPVSRAARRAFWPSRPMASDSW